MAKRILAMQESDLRMNGDLAMNIQRVLPVTQADIDAAAAVGQGWVVEQVFEVSLPIDNTVGQTWRVIKVNSITPGQNVKRVMIVPNPYQKTIVVSGIPPLQLLGAVEDSLTSLKAFGGTKEKPSDIPAEYTEVEYVERPSGTTTEQYVETNWKPDLTKDVRIEGRTEYCGTGTYRPLILGNYKSSYSSALSVEFRNGGFILYSMSSEAGSGHQFSTGSFTNGDIVDFDVQITGNTGASTISATSNGTTTTNTDTIDAAGEICSLNMRLFRDYRTSTLPAGYQEKLRIYSLKATEGGVKVLDLVPVKRESDNVVGFYDKVSGQFLTNQGTGSLTAGNEVLPTPSDPMDIYCNNGKISVLDHTNWNVITNPTSQTGQGMFINSDGKLQKANDRGAGVFIPVTVGKQYTLLINKKTTALGSIIRYGQSNNGDLPNSAEQLLDWYRGSIEDGMMISFTAKRPYFVMQLAASLVEATGGIDEAIEVIEAAGDYTFLKYITTTGTQYIETDLSGAARWVGAGQGTSQSSGSKVIVSAYATQSGVSKGAVIWLGSRLGSADTGKYWTLGGASSTGLSISTVDTLDYAEYDVTFNNDKFTGTINNMSFTDVPNTWDIGFWRIGSSFTQGSTTANYYFIGKIYRQKAYQNDVLVGDFIPAIRNSDSAVGMLDIVSGTFYENAGTGTFGAGDIIGSGETISVDPKGTLATANNLFAINTYKDVQEIITGATTHNVNVYVLTGTENWGLSGGIYYLEIVGTVPLTSSVASNVCSHYKSLKNDESFSSYSGVNCIRVGHTTNLTWQNRIAIQDTTGYADVAAFKAWLAAQYAAGTPVIIVYPLATEFVEPAPVAQSMTVVAGDNTLSLTQQGMPNLELEATYTAGVSVTITEIENANVGNDVDVVIA